MSIRISIFFLFAVAGLFIRLQAQVKFNPELLNDPKKNGLLVSTMLSTQEVYEYKQDPSLKCVYLENGFRTPKFVNENDWLLIKDTVEAYRIDIVYSKYPLHNGMYEEIYPLLLNRIKTTIEMDPELNDEHYEWNKVLQTHCTSDKQVNTLYHGVVIWYRLNKKQELNADTLHEEEPVEIVKEEIPFEQDHYKNMVESVDHIKKSGALPDSLKLALEGRPVQEQSAIIKEFLEEKLKNSKDIDLSKATKEEKNKYKKQVDEFMSRYQGSEKVVEDVLNRHPEWKNVIVVNDWTGSMYGYGAQVLKWHLLNFEKSGITSITLFNDGDSKTTDKKRVGETGGIYSEEADNVPQLIDLFNISMLKGTGGDGPENDIEGILKAQEMYPDHAGIILIADNNACVRDIELADRIGEPVKIILCGYKEKYGVNPDYVYLAKKTGGGIYTIEQDIEDIQASVGAAGEIVDFPDTRIKLSSKKCGGGSWMGSTDYTEKVFDDYNKAKRHKKKIRKLELVKQHHEEIPRGVYKMKKLNHLDMSNNAITKVSSKISKLEYLKVLNLSNNSIIELPSELGEVDFIEELYLSNNQLSHVGSEITAMSFLKILNLSNNRIEKIDSYNRMKKLEDLNLSGNNLSELPKSFSMLKKLKKLNLSNNKFKVFPVSLLGLSKLEELDLSGN
ncbi:MAG TPA: leucine-rich repeat domain-containing protein, partial [Bacteroidia bacterium]